ncbi:unnamed protein product [Parascedosporium putredinis]|uniref:SEC7 domain-containing protein n=1 Tax=Parascedosporium putredinis TaxID=1442378 RepID=A0A9P1HC12_9PEZI|nr:unnamed protein product [Parascedosporium putredinis]CAI8004488.1 unnamed protein product [Parascedosporium putredinis]
MRIMALRILHVALEVAGPYLVKYSALGHITEDSLCRFLFQLVRSDNLDLLQESLVVASTLLGTCRGVLKLQQELFLSYLVACLHPALEIPRVVGIDPLLYASIPQVPKLVKPPASQNVSGRSTPVQVKDRQKLGLEGGARKPDARQAMVECISVLLRMPSYMVELFVNYDCDEDRVDLCEDMIGLLSRNALPDSATWSTTSVPPLCLDALLRYIQFLAQRLEWQPILRGLPDPVHLKMRRQKKKVIINGASKFNENPKNGLGYLEAHGIISSMNDPSSVAAFLKRTERISKKALGEFLSKRGNETILQAFLNLFDFSGKRVDEALRVLLESFRLPGESALIERILSSFSEMYYLSSHPLEVADKDAVYVLTYAIIMLNTDQHNPQIKAAKRMSFEDFSRNLRGVNGGEDFSPDYLGDIFNSIRLNEIILPDEHDNQHAFDYAWRELLSKSATAGPAIECKTNIYDADLFSSTWRPVVSALSYVFMSATDDTVFARVVTGFDECARIAAKYGVVEALDHIVHALSQMTTIATTTPFSTDLNTEVQAGGNSVVVSKMPEAIFRSQEIVVARAWDGMLDLWIRIVDILDRLMNSGQGDSLSELALDAEGVYVNNLEERVRIEQLKDALAQIFSEYGTLVEIVAKSNLRAKGQAFIVFSEPDAAQAAISELQGFELFEKPMRLALAKSRSDATVRNICNADEFDQHKRKRAADKDKRRATEAADQQKKLKLAATLQDTTSRGESTRGAGLKANNPSTATLVPDEYLPPNKTLFAQNIPDDYDVDSLTSIFGRFNGKTLSANHSFNRAVIML